jgi:hypothetical protein
MGARITQSAADGTWIGSNSARKSRSTLVGRRRRVGPFSANSMTRRHGAIVTQRYDNIASCCALLVVGDAFSRPEDLDHRKSA